MKRLILMLSTAVCLLSSCQNYLDLKPKNQTVVGTLEDVKLMMSSYLFSLTSSDGYPIYFNGVAMHFPYNRDAIASFTMYSDDLDMRRAIENSYGRKYEKEYYESTDWKSSIFSETIWNNFYLHIGYMNSVMKSLGELLGSYEQSDFEKIKGEALTIRAFYIFKLLQLFAPYDNNELGIPLNLDPEVIEGTKRLSQQEVYKRIIGDLTEALNYETANDTWNVFYNKDIIHALLAQVYTFKAESAAKEEKDWEEAEKHSDYIVQRYQLAQTADELKSVIRPGAAGVIKNPHCLLTLGWDITPRSNSYSFWGLPQYGTGQVVSPDLLATYTPGDYRPGLYFYVSEEDGVMYQKFEYVTWTLSDYITLFRVADMYLICAEANTRLNRPKGKELLETFKKSRITGFTTYNGNDVLDEIIRERRKEFCGEYDMRWLDMKRLKMAVSREGIDEKSQQVKTYKLESNDYRYALKIPIESELVYNKICLLYTSDAADEL